MKTLTFTFLYGLLIACGSQNRPSLDMNPSEISDSILQFYKDEPKNTGFVSDIRWYLNNLKAVDFSAAKVVHVTGFFDKKTSTVALTIHWVGTAKDTTLEIVGAAGGKSPLIQAEFVDESSANHPIIATYIGCAYFRVPNSQWDSLVKGGWAKFCVGGTKVDNASMFTFIQDAKGNIKGLNMDAKSDAKKSEADEGNEERNKGGQNKGEAGDMKADKHSGKGGRR